MELHWVDQEANEDDFAIRPNQPIDQLAESIHQDVNYFFQYLQFFAHFHPQYMPQKFTIP